MKKLRSLIKSLTLADYIVGGILALGLLFLFFFLRRGNTMIPITIKVTNPDVLTAYARPNNEYVLSFVKNDVERDELGQVVATIEDVNSIYSAKDFPAVYLKLQVKALYSPLKKQHSLKGKPVIYGQGYTFSFSNVKFEGIVVDFPGFQTSEPLIEKTVKIKAELKEDNRNFSDVYGVLPFMANAVKVGDQIKDEKGNTIVEVLAVENKPAKRTILAADGSPRVVDDPRLRDVTYTFEVKIKTTAHRKFYQDFIVVEVGVPLPLAFKDVSIFPTVTQISE